MARPKKLTPEVHDGIVSLLRQGCYAEHAAAAVGISETTYYKWMKLGRESDSGPHWELVQAVAQATSEALNDSLKRVQIASRDDWRAAAWFLERRSPTKWGRHDRQDVNVTGAQPIAFQIVTQGEPDEASKPDDDES